MKFSDFSLIDLTHTLNPDAPTWNGSCGFTSEIKMDYPQGLRVQQIKMHAGIGTHMDAPSHFFQGAPSIHAIPLQQLLLPACVIDVSQKADALYEISVEDLQNYEKNHGRIPANTLVIGYTGWDRFWNDSTRYRNVTADRGMCFPTFSKESAQFLLERDVAGIAIDTLSPDREGSSFPVHKLLLGAGKYIIENIANAAQLPPKGAQVIALPIPAQDCTEAPLRLIALLDMP